MEKCNEVETSIKAATKYIMETNFINNDEGVCIIFRNIVHALYTRPHGLFPMVNLYKSLISLADETNNLGKMNEFLFDFDNAFANIKSSIVLIYHLYLKKVFSDDFIYNKCLRAIKKRPNDHRLIILLYSYFAPLLDRCYHDLYLEYNELLDKINTKYTDEPDGKSFFFYNFCTNWANHSLYYENDWEFQLECAKYGHPIGSLKYNLKYDNVEALLEHDNLTSLVGYKHDELYEYHDQLEQCQSFLQFAAFYGSYHCFLALVRARGMYDHGRLSDDGTLNKMAIYGGNKEIIKLCDIAGINSKRALHYCVMTHRNNLLSYFIVSNSYEASNYNEDYVKENLLHSSTLSNNMEAILYCLQNGNDINKQTRLGETPMHYAAKHYAFDALEFLFSYKKIRVLYSSTNTVSFSFILSLILQSEVGH